MTEYEVFVPAYDAAETIEATLRSLGSQALPPARVTVLDDGSSDDTVDRARRHDVNVVPLTHQGNAATRGTAVDMARSPWFAIVDADDEWAGEMGGRLVEEATRAPATVAAVGALLEPHGGAAEVRPWRRQTARQSAGSPSLVDAATIWARNPFMASATLFRTSALQALPEHRRDLPCASDYFDLVNLWAHGNDLLLVPEVHGRYYVRPRSMTSRVARCVTAEAAVIQFLHASSRRETELPDVSLDDRLRAAWRRGVARAAHMHVPPATLPPLDTLIDATMGDIVVDRVARNRFAGALAASTWRMLTRWRSS